jgi:glycerol-3-phosphate cytidylyltransferase-like family protein
VIDPTFLAKYNIDYVAHDDEPYLSAGHDDVYAYVKSIGSSAPRRRTCGLLTCPQANLYQRVARREFQPVHFWNG